MSGSEWACDFLEYRAPFGAKNKSMDSVQRGGGGQPQIQTFLNVFLVKVKSCSKVLGHLE